MKVAVISLDITLRTLLRADNYAYMGSVVMPGKEANARGEGLALKRAGI